MKEFKLFSYIKRYKAYIVISSLMMGVLFYTYFSGKQTYTASAIIQYKNSEAAQGFAPDGTEIDITEIYSSEVMTRVFEKLGISYSENNIDTVRANVYVEAIQNEEDAIVQEALNEKGEVAEEKPTMYLVSYTVESKDVQNAAEFSKNMLQTMLNIYVEVYAENHINSTVPLQSVVGIYDKDYDYIEMVEILDSAVRQALEELFHKTKKNFRSVATGYSFSDIRREFFLLSEIDLPNAYAYILGNQITKDQDILLSKYENRIQNAVLQNDKSDAESRGVEEIIESYVQMMRNSQNTDFTYEYILQEVYESEYETADGKKKRLDQTTEYDNLMSHFVSERTSYEEMLIDIAYDQYILEVYSGNVNEGDGVTVEIVDNPGEFVEEDQPGTTEQIGEEGMTAFDVETVIRKDIVSSEESQQEAYKMIEKITDQIVRLNQVTQLTNQEYNRFVGAGNIAIMTDAIAVPALNLLLYAVLAVILFGFIGCVFAVLVGRILEIFDYYMFIDKKLNIANRAGCDRYILKYGKTLLPSNFVCIALRISDIEEKNKRYGREKCDQMMGDFCKILNEVLPSEQAFVANNGLGQFIVFLQNSDREQAHAYVHEIGRRCVSYNKEKECRISYTCGISISGGSQIYDIRKLMVDSMSKASTTAIRKIS